MSRFYITVEVERKPRRYLVEQLPDDPGFETYRITGANKSLVMRSNRPMLRVKGLKHRRPSWQVIDGAQGYSSAFDKLKDALMAVIDR